MTNVDPALNDDPLAVALASCDREPIRIPGSIQPYGVLLVVDPATEQVLQAAIGAPGLVVGDDPVGRPLMDVLPSNARPAVADLGTRVPETGVVHLGVVAFPQADDWRFCHAIAHRSGPAIILEFEESVRDEPCSFEDIYPHVRAFLEQLQVVASTEDLAELAAREVRRLTGLDRALVYRFDEDWNGTVVAEDRNDVLPSYLDLRFPASDIPAQARELYRLNRLRLIADANYEPVPLLPPFHPRTGEPVDLGFSVLRSVSPVHCEYMRNMGTHASMSISLLRDGKLWGLISCHNAAPKRVPYHVRTACDLIGQILSLQLAAKEHAAMAERRIAHRVTQTRLLAHMAAEDHFLDGLVRNGGGDLLAVAGGAGAAIVFAGHISLVGEAPSKPDVARIVAWLSTRPREEIFVTDSLASLMPEAEDLKDHASGLIAASISQLHDSYVLWFRPEFVRTVSWGGDPRKRAELEPSGLRLHPRTSFEVWKETVRLKSAPWHRTEIDAAGDLRNTIIDIVLRRAEELAAISEQLTRSNKELEAFSYSVSHDLRAPFRHIVGYAQLLKSREGQSLTDRGRRFVDTIIESAISAGTLVDNLLSYSQMGRATLVPILVDMNALMTEVRRLLAPEMHGRDIEWRVEDLAPTRGDPTMLRFVLQNLLSNAIKFTRDRRPAIIEIGCRVGESETTYSIKDNGAGFDGAYVGKLFGVFQRLHRAEEFEGTGIGLANVRRIVERHGGRTWAEGEVDKGATIFFTLPRALSPRTDSFEG